MGENSASFFFSLSTTSLPSLPLLIPLSASFLYCFSLLDRSYMDVGLITPNEYQLLFWFLCLGIFFPSPSRSLPLILSHSHSPLAVHTLIPLPPPLSPLSLPAPPNIQNTESKSPPPPKLLTPKPHQTLPTHPIPPLQQSRHIHIQRTIHLRIRNQHLYRL